MALFRSDKKYNGEKSPYYVLREKAMKEISELVPDAKLFVCIRHPIQMVHSFYNFRIFEFKHGYPAGIDPDKYSFEDIVLNDLEINGFSIDHGRYIAHIKSNALKYFPAEQIYFVIQERMMANMNVEMNKIFEHLGLPPCKSEFVTKIKHHNEQFRYETIDYSSPLYTASLEKLCALYKPYNEELCDFLGQDIEEWRYFDNMYR